LGAGPGSVLEWVEADGVIVVRRKGKYSSLEIHKIVFPDGPPKRKSVEEMDRGIRDSMRKRHARD